MCSKCGGCFSGLVGNGQAKFSPDPSAGLNATQVASIQEAMSIKRPHEGAFLPSPTAAWASPAPAGGAVGAIDLDFEIVMSELENLDAAKGTLAGQLDTDGMGRMAGSQPRALRQCSRFEAEQILALPDSLPKPLAADERENLIRSQRPTSTQQMLAKVPRQLLHASTEDSQHLRRTLARGATIVFVGAGLPGKRFTFERAAALGMKVVVSARRQHRAASSGWPRPSYAAGIAQQVAAGHGQASPRDAVLSRRGAAGRVCALAQTPPVVGARRCRALPAGLASRTSGGPAARGRGCSAMHFRAVAGPALARGDAYGPDRGSRAGHPQSWAGASRRGRPGRRFSGVRLWRLRRFWLGPLRRRGRHGAGPVRPVAGSARVLPPPVPCAEPAPTPRAMRRPRSRV